MKSLSCTSWLIGLITLQLHTTTASPSPIFFDDIKTAWDDSEAPISTIAPAATATATETTLTYPGCNASADKWCGITRSGPAARDISYNVSITDSQCRTVTTQTNVKKSEFDTYVGRWAFEIQPNGLLNLTYDGRNISNPTKWDSYGYEVVASTVNHARLCRGITNCTAAETSISAAVPMLTVSGAVWAMAAVAGLLATL